VAQNASMTILGRLIPLSFKHGIWGRLRCQRTFAIDNCRGHSVTARAGAIAVELDRPSPSPIETLPGIPAVYS